MLFAETSWRQISPGQHLAIYIKIGAGLIKIGAGLIKIGAGLILCLEFYVIEAVQGPQVGSEPTKPHSGEFT